MSRVQEVLDRGWPAVALGAVGLGLAAANWIAFPLLAGVAASIAAVGAAFRLPPKLRLALAAIALSGLGLWWGGLRLHELDRSYLATRIGEPAGAKIVVTGAASVSPYAVRVAADVRRFDGIELRERVLLELPAGRAPPQGAVLDLRARPVAPRGPETGFDERGWLERRGIHVVLHASGPWHVVGRRGGIGGVGDRLRTEIGNALSLGTTGERRSLLVGVVLGADEGIDPELRDAFKASGLYHLLAVSGQNIVLIGFGVLGLAYVLGLGRAVGHSLAIIAILAYALAVGWQPSVVRAAVAGCLASLAWLLSRPSDRWHTMAMGAVVLLAWTPRSLLEPGFQLSFAAVGAIFLTMPRLRRLHEGYPVPAGVVEVIGISAACGIVTAPILWLQFGAIPLWTVPANALAEPAMPILLGCGLGAAVLAPVIPPAAVALSWIAGAAAAWIAFSARLIASLPYAQTSSRTLVLALAGAVAAVVALRLVPSYSRRAVIITAVALVPLAWIGWWALHPPPTWSPPTGLRVSFLDVGQGDGILLETPEGAMLVDAGPPEARVDRQLRRMGLHSLAAIVISHAHRDHVGGVPAVLRSLAVGAVIDPMQPGQGSDERAMRSTARRLRVPLRPARMGRRYALGRLELRVLWPDHAGSPDENPHLHGAVVLATYGSIDLLLTGDSEAEVTRSLPLRHVEVLKVAHHGSSDPGLAEELRVLRPRLAVISVAAHNDYGHPRADTLAALHDRPGLAVYRTDESGRIVLESDGRSLLVRDRALSCTVGSVSERPSLKPAYLISGTDRPKVETAVQRLRARFVPESVEIASALEASGADVVTLCNSGSLFGDARLVVVTDIDGQKKDPNRPPTGGWKAADIEAVATYLAAPAPDTVLALVGLEVKKDAPIAKTCAKTGDLLIYDVAKSGRVAWVAERFRQAGVKAEADACALLIEYVGEDDLHGLANEIDKIATWAHGEPVGVAEIEQLVSPLADVPSFALTDAWADRHPGHLLDLSETLFDRSDKPRRDTAPRLAATLNSHLTRMRQLKRLAAQGVPAPEAAATLKMHPFYGKKVYKQAEAFSDDELASATVRFAELDLALKGGSRLAPDVELLRALIDVSAEPGRD